MKPSVTLEDHKQYQAVILDPVFGAKIIITKDSGCMIIRIDPQGDVTIDERPSK